MANWGFTDEEIDTIRKRDTACVYCGKKMLPHFSRTNQKDSPTIEHLHHEAPFRKHEGLKLEGLAICCGDCNSRRSNKDLRAWLKERGIPEDAVAQPVRHYLASRK